MDLYLFIFLLCALASIIQQRTINVTLGNITLLLMWYMTSFRASTVGVDTQQYLLIYSIEQGASLYTNEYVFSFLYKWCYAIFGSTESCQVLMSSITYLPLSLIFNRYSCNIGISILVFLIATNRYFFETFNIVRQMAATPYLLLAWIYLSKRKYILSTLFIIFAVGLHNSSLIYIPIAILAYQLKVSYMFAIIGELLTLTFAFVFADMDVMGGLFVLFQGMDLMRMDGYAHFATYELQLTRTVYGLITLLLPHFFVILIAYHKFRDEFIMRLYLWASLTLNIVGVTPISYRMTFGIIAVELILYPMLLSKSLLSKSGKVKALGKGHIPLNKELRLILGSFLLVLYSYSLYNFIKTAKLAQLIPYSTF